MSEKIQWFVLGCAVGAIVGYMVRSLREIKEELDDVDDHVKKMDERGASVPSYVNNIALFLALVVTVFAAFSSQRASNQTDRVASCTQSTLSNTVTALNERTTYTVAQAEANVDLQKAQTAFLAVVVTKPAVPESVSTAALQTYFDKLTEFVTLSTQTVNKIENNPYPTNGELQSCLDND